MSIYNRVYKPYNIFHAFWKLAPRSGWFEGLKFDL
jgi:hypothetical protein